MNLHLETGAALASPKQIDDPVAAPKRQPADVLPNEVFGDQRLGGVEVLILEREQKSLHRARIVDAGK